MKRLLTATLERLDKTYAQDYDLNLYTDSQDVDTLQALNDINDPDITGVVTISDKEGNLVLTYVTESRAPYLINAYYRLA